MNPILAQVYELLKVLASHIGTEVNLAEIEQVVILGELAHFGDFKAIATAILADSAKCFPDALTRPFFEGVIRAVSGVTTVRAAKFAASQDPGVQHHPV